SCEGAVMAVYTDISPSPRSDVMAVYTAITWSSRDEVDPNRRVVQTHRLPPREQLTYRRPPLVAVVLGQVVHVHAHEAIGEALVDPAPELHRVSHRRLAVREARSDRLAQDLRQVVQPLRAEVSAGNVDTQGQR